ncbi:MAG: glycosyltransferase [Rhodospirillales bacterium]
MTERSSPSPHSAAQAEGSALPAVLMAMAGRGAGGAESVFCRLAGALAGRGVAVSALVRPQQAIQGSLGAAGVPHETAPFHLRFDLTTPRRLRRLLASQRPDIVLAFMQRAAAAIPPGPYCLLGRLGGPYPLRRFRHCDSLIVPAPRLHDHVVAAGWAAARVHLLPNFLADRYDEVLPPTVQARPESGSVLLGLGRLHAVKGFDLLLQALTRLPGAQLWLAGAGPAEAALKRLAGSLNLADRVRFLGWQTDPLPLLRQADLLVVPSRREPFGNVVLEGWMAGCPVLASDADGPAWLIEREVSGELVPRGDSAALATAIARLLAEPERRRALARGGRKAYLEGFTEARGVQAYLDLFQRLRAGPKQSAG